MQSQKSSRLLDTVTLRLRFADLGASRSGGDFFVNGLGWIVLTERLRAEWQSCRWRGVVELKWSGCCWLPQGIVLLGYEL